MLHSLQQLEPYVKSWSKLVFLRPRSAPGSRKTCWIESVT